MRAAVVRDGLCRTLAFVVPYCAHLLVALRIHPYAFSLSVYLCLIRLRRGHRYQRVAAGARRCKKSARPGPYSAAVGTATAGPARSGQGAQDFAQESGTIAKPRRSTRSDLCFRTRPGVRGDAQGDHPVNDSQQGPDAGA